MSSAADTQLAQREIGPVSRTDFVRFAGAGGDFNPVHHDDEYARRLGFPSVFAMGMFPAGLLGGYVADWLGVHALHQLTIRFAAPTWPDDVLVIAASDVVDDEGSGTASLSVTAGGEPRLTGAVSFGDATIYEPRPVTAVVPDDARLAGILATELEPVELPVERGKILEYARAVRAGELHRDLSAARAAGFEDLLAPPTFTVCVAHWAGGDATEVPRRAGLDLARVLHAEQRYTFHRPVIAGDLLSGARRISSVVTKSARSGGEMTFVTVSTDFVDESGHPVVGEEMVMVERPGKPSETSAAG